MEWGIGRSSIHLITEPSTSSSIFNFVLDTNTTPPLHFHPILFGFEFPDLSSVRIGKVFFVVCGWGGGFAFFGRCGWGGFCGGGCRWGGFVFVLGEGGFAVRGFGVSF